MSSMSTVWEDTNGCANKSIFALDVYLMPVISSSYIIITDRAITVPVYENNVIDGINTTKKRYMR